MILGDISQTFDERDLTPRDLQLQILQTYFTVGSTAVLIWDIILHVPEDYRQIRKQGFLKLSRIVYCFSRLSTLIYMVSLCVIQTVPIGNCTWVRYVAYIFPFTIPIILLLFLFRVYALFRNRSYVLVFVFLSWLLVVGSAIFVAVRTEGVNINESNFCMEKKYERDLPDAVSTIIRFFHDTLVFIVTSWWLYQSHSINRGGFPSMIFGRHLFPFTRSLLHDGQAYYLTTLILNAIVISLPLMTNPFVTPCTLGSPLLVLINNMASHVYRNLISARYLDHPEFMLWVDGKEQEDTVDLRGSSA